MSVPPDLDLRDSMCTICLSIFIEPVTMPCDHTMCKVCFERSMEVNRLACPLCKKRIAVWCRKNAKNLINQKLWNQIQKKFPKQVALKQSGVDLEGEELEELFPCVPTHCHVEEGQIGEEFKKQMSEFSYHEKDRKEKEKEKIIQMLGLDSQAGEIGKENGQEIDENVNQELMMEQERLLKRIEQERKDEALARALSSESASPSSSVAKTPAFAYSGKKRPGSHLPSTPVRKKSNMRQLSLKEVLTPKNK